VKDFERDPEAYKHRADTFFQRGALSSEDCWTCKRTGL
jgi:hypothetical protein